jgi:hypothetical protein
MVMCGPPGERPLLNVLFQLSPNCAPQPPTNRRNRPPPQVEKVGREVFQPYCLNDCLQVAFDRASIFFRKVEIRKTDDLERMLLMSALAEMWRGQRPFGPAGEGGLAQGGEGARILGGRRAGGRERVTADASCHLILTMHAHTP